VHCVAFRNSVADRSFTKEYTIISANSWEYKTLTVSGGLITAGTWNWTNSTGLIVDFTLAAGSTFQTTADAWQTGNFLATANQVNVMDNTANDFFITGVQLEPGTVATPFERRIFGQELALCQRYFYKSDQEITALSPYSAPSSTSDLLVDIQFPVTMRTTPTIALGTQSPGGGAATLPKKDGFRFGGITGAANTAYSVLGFTASAEL
jgi:hypothetical protein